VRSLKYIGIDGYVEDGSQRSFFPNGFAMYTYAEALLDNDITFEQITEDYFSHIYGEDWKTVHAALTKLMDLFEFSAMEGERTMDKTKGNERVIVCDPPRKGMERSVIKAILQSGAQRLVLVSCNPATLARDLGMLCGSLTEKDGQLVKNPDYALGKTQKFYKIEKVIPFDMFPQTKHVETVVCLTKE
jgi:hypothetical protein